MSQALRHMTGEANECAIERRLVQKIHGLGYWAAADASDKRIRAAQAELRKAVAELAIEVATQEE